MRDEGLKYAGICADKGGGSCFCRFQLRASFALRGIRSGQGRLGDRRPTVKYITVIARKLAWPVYASTPMSNPSATIADSAATAHSPALSLPGYAKSLLRIKVPVIVTLAAKKQPVGCIVELGSGSIIQFDKSCEEMLQMHVDDQLIAEGEAVKVGDKFGIRLTSLVVPGERFKPVRKS